MTLMLRAFEQLGPQLIEGGLQFAQQLENAADQSQFAEATRLLSELQTALDQLRPKLLERP